MELFAISNFITYIIETCAMSPRLQRWNLKNIKIIIIRLNWGMIEVNDCLISFCFLLFCLLLVRNTVAICQCLTANRWAGGSLIDPPLKGGLRVNFLKQNKKLPEKIFTAWVHVLNLLNYMALCACQISCPCRRKT